MTTRAVALIVLLASAVAAGCGDDADDDGPAAAAGPCGAPRSVEGRFGAMAGNPRQGEAGLGHTHESYEPGQRFSVVPLNRSSAAVSYGLAYSLERRVSGRWVAAPGPAETFRRQRFTARAGSTGPCVTISVRADATPGTYRVTLAGSRPALRSTFRVAGLRSVGPGRPEERERETTIPRRDDPSGTGPGAPEPGLQSVP